MQPLLSLNMRPAGCYSDALRHTAGEERPTCRKFRPMMKFAPSSDLRRDSICSVVVLNVTARSSLLPPAFIAGKWSVHE